MLRNHPDFQVRLGDIVVYLPVSRAGWYPFAQMFVKDKIYIAHRVLSIYNLGDRSLYMVKGDNNPKEDPWTITDEDIFGKVIKIIPSELVDPDTKKELLERW